MYISVEILTGTFSAIITDATLILLGKIRKKNKPLVTNEIPQKRNTRSEPKSKIKKYF